MMNILYINGVRFVKALRRKGCKVVTVGHEDYFDVMLNDDEYSIDIALQRAGFEPDLVLVESFGPKPFFAGIEECASPTALYAVDSSINLYWLEHYAKIFDFVFVDQKDALELLQSKGIESEWLPLAIEAEDYPPLENNCEYDITFVGRMNLMRRKRHALIDELKKRYDVSIGGGDGDNFLYFTDAARFHAKGKMALNENLFDGVTHRIIEIMASGTMLLTEEAVNGLSDLFNDGEHLVTFNPANMHEKIEFYLAYPEKRRFIGGMGRAEVMKNHTYDARVEKLLTIVASKLGSIDTNRNIIEQFRNTAKTYYLAALRWSDMAMDLLARAEKACLTVMESGSHDPEIYKLMGILHGKWGDPAQAEDFLRNAVQLNPADYQTHMFLGHFYQKSGRPEEAVRSFTAGIQSIAYVPEDLKDKAADLLNNSGIDGESLIALGDIIRYTEPSWAPGFIKYQPDEFPVYPAEYYERASREFNLPQGNVSLAECYAETGIHDEAFNRYDTARIRIPNDPELLFNAAKEAAFTYKYRESAAVLSEALRLNPEFKDRIDEIPLPEADKKQILNSINEELVVRQIHNLSQ